MTAEPFLPVPPPSEHPGARPGDYCHCGRPMPCGWHAEAKPLPKTAQLARGERRYRRRVASAKQWAVIAAAKQGPCRVCRATPPNELHHLIPRGRGGSDVADNIVPLCRSDHAAVEVRRSFQCRRLAESLTDAEYAYAIEAYGERFFEARLGISYERGAS